MANSYKNIVITPNTGSTTGDPTIVFSGGDTNTNTDITLRVYPTSNGTLSFEGNAGQLFSITNDLSNTIFSVNDVSGIPLLEINVASQQITLGQFYGNVGIGTNASNVNNYKLDVIGGANISLPNLTVGGTNVSAAIAAANANAATLSANVNVLAAAVVANDASQGANIATLAASFVSNSQTLSANVNTFAATFASANANTVSLSTNVNVLAAAFVSNSQSLSANVNTLAATFASANANNISLSANVNVLAASFVSNSQSLSANVNVLAAVAAAALANTSGVSFNGNLNFPTGSVGIGTTSPSANLHVQGNANITLPDLVVGGTNVIAAIVASNANDASQGANIAVLAASFVSNSQSLSANVNTLASNVNTLAGNTASLSTNVNSLVAYTTANDASQGANIAVLAASFVSNSQSLSANVNTLAATFVTSNANTISLSTNVNVLAANVNTLAGAAYPKTGGTISGDATVTGNLTVSGTTTFVNTQILLIGDATIVLNADVPGNVQPTENAGLEINRGARNSNAAFIWNETGNSWQFTSNTLAGVYSIVASQIDANNVGAAANNFAAATYLTQSAYNTANANAVSLSANVNALVAYTTANDASQGANIATLAAAFVSNSQSLSANVNTLAATFASANANTISLSTNVNVLAASFVSNSQSLSANVNTLAATFASANANNISLSANVNTLAAALVLANTSSHADIDALSIVANTKLANTSGVSFNGNLFFPTGNVTIGSAALTSYVLDTISDISAYPTSGAGLFYITAANSTSSSNTSIIFRAYDTTSVTRHGAAIQMGKDGAWTGGSGVYPGFMSFWTRESGGTNAEVERMRITSAGDVGIGTTTTNPIGTSRNLAISGSATSSFSLSVGATVGAYFSTDASTYAQFVTPSTVPILFLTNNTERMRIAANGNIGIGTTSPGHKLSIGAQTGGTSTATPDTISIGSTYSSAAGTNAKLRLFWDGAITYGFGVSSSQLDYIVSGAYSHVWYSNGSERMRIDSSGNVAIGITTASYLFDVYNSSTASNYYISRLISEAAATGTSVTHLRLEKGNGYGGTVGGYISQGVGSGLVLSTLNAGTLSNAMWINNSGNVGIGTASPLGKLTVTGGASGTSVTIGSTDIGTGTWIRNDGVHTVFSTNIGSMYFGLNGSSKNLLFYPGGSTAALTVGTDSIVTASYQLRAPIFYDSDNTAYYVDPAGTSVLTRATLIGSTSTGIVVNDGGGAANYNYVMSAANDTGTKLVMFINGSARSADGGTNALTIRNDGGNLNLGAASYLTSLYGTYTLAYNSMRSPIFYDSDNTAYYVDPGNATVLNGLYSNFLRLGPTNIGGQAASAIGAAYGLNGTGASLFAWNYSSGGGELDLIINRNGGGTGGLTVYDFNSNTITNLMTLTGAGNLGLGLGAALPAYKLDVNGTTHSTDVYTDSTFTAGNFATTGTNGTLRITTASGASYIQSGLALTSGSAAPLVFSNIFATSEWARFNSSGNFGIGTTNPDAKLHVLGGAIMPAVGSTSSSGIQWPSNPGGGAGDSAFIRYYVVAGESTKFQIGTDNDADDTIALYQQGADRLTVYNGNIGIGTSSPSVLLELGGQATPQVKLLSTTNAVDTRLLSIGAGNAGIVGTYSNHDLSIYANAAERMRITSGGNVGIGTNSPIAKLDVSRYITHTHEWASKAYTGGTWYRFLTLTGANAGQELRVVLRNPNGHDSVEITIAKHTTGAGNAGVVASIRRLGSYAYTHNITKIRICDDGTNSTTHLEVQFGANHTSTLNMGISGLMNAGFTVVDMTTGAVGSSSTKELFVSDGVSSTTNQTMIGYSTLSNDLMYLNTNGNLGIGTASPTSTLDVRGNVSIPSDSLSFGTSVLQKINLFSTVYGIGIQNNTQYFRTGSRFSWFAGGVHSATENDPGSGGAVAMTLTNGNLSVYSGVTQYPTTLILVPSTHATSRRAAIGIGDWTPLQDINGNGTRDFTIYNSSSGIHGLTIRTDGNVGIGGTTSAAYKLQVTGASGTAQIYASSSDASYSRIGLSNSNRHWTLTNYGTSFSPNGRFAIADESAAAVRFTIDTDGIVTSLNEFRAPIFKDTDNTGYYLDPAGISRTYIIESDQYKILNGGVFIWAHLSAALNNKYWDTYSDSAGVLRFRAVNDAYTAATDWLNVTRSGQTPQLISLFANTTITGALTVQTGGGTITGGFIVAPGNLGTISSGTTTLSAASGNYQYYTNGGAHTIAAPSSDCAIDVLVTNGVGSGAITLSGFTAPTGGGGDTYSSTYQASPLLRFLLMVRRINGVSTYSWKALQ